MISQKEMLDIIATEAVELPVRERQPLPEKAEACVRYNLRLVRHEDGRLEWKDE